MFPLSQRKLIRGAKEHLAAGLGIAADYVANYTNLFSPFDGMVECYSGVEGGKWVRVTRANGDKIEMAHNSAYKVSNGQVREGQLIAITGNTGTITTGPHLHIQIINKAGQRLDPELYDWVGKKEMIGYKLLNNPTVYVELDGNLVAVADWPAFASLGGSGDSIVELNQNQLDKFTIINSIIFKSK